MSLMKYPFQLWKCSICRRFKLHKTLSRGYNTADKSGGTRKKVFPSTSCINTRLRVYFHPGRVEPSYRIIQMLEIKFRPGNPIGAKKRNKNTYTFHFLFIFLHSIQHDMGLRYRGFCLNTQFSHIEKLHATRKMIIQFHTTFSKILRPIFYILSKNIKTTSLRSTLIVLFDCAQFYAVSLFFYFFSPHVLKSIAPIVHVSITI